MAAMLIRLQVTDFAAWMPAFAEEGSVRRAHGVRQEHVFRNALDPNEVFVLLDWDDLARARLYADSDDARVAAWQAVVTDAPEVWLLQETQTGERGVT